MAFPTPNACLDPKPKTVCSGSANCPCVKSPLYHWRNTPDESLFYSNEPVIADLSLSGLKLNDWNKYILSTNSGNAPELTRSFPTITNVLQISVDEKD